MNDEPMVDEFDTVATWTADAVDELGQEHALPAACRGSGSPAALRWVADRLDVAAGTRLLDSGAGVGGPAQLVREERGAVPTLVEPMAGACSAAARLFDHRVVVGDGAALPVGDGTYDVAWSLGVLSTVEDKAAHLAELRRSVGPGGRVGLLVFVRTVAHLPDEPEGNSFVTEAELDDLVRAAGLEILAAGYLDDHAAAPPEWQEAVAAVDAVVERDHGDSDAYRSAARNQERMADLIDDGSVAGRLLACAAAKG